jgi:geranylgeranyl pyrophosphate synthase
MQHTLQELTSVAAALCGSAARPRAVKFTAPLNHFGRHAAPFLDDDVPGVPYPACIPLEDRAEFFGRVSAWVHAAIAKVFPRAASDAMGLTGVDVEWGHAELAALEAGFVAPIWSLVERRGKCWRPYFSALACEAVGGDARVLWPRVITVLELIQVGSLMVDDVEDGSTVRRNGPASHLIHGVGRVVNAGTLCYLLGPSAFADLPLPAEDRHEILMAYLQMLAAAHLGQALDIETVSDGLAEVIVTGDSQILERRVQRIHHLKTGRFIGFMAKVGAKSGGANAVQVKALEQYGLALGSAFQAMDDCSNLRGFDGDLRPVAEDLYHGKPTLPFVRALGRLPKSQRQWLVDTLRTTDPGRAAEAVAMIDQCGALRDCAEDAERDVQTAMQAVMGCLPDSSARAMLCEFGLELLRDRR